MMRIAFLADDKNLRERLVREIGRSRRIKLVGGYATAEEALRGIPMHKPNAVLMAVVVPEMDGVECSRQLRALCLDFVVRYFQPLGEGEGIPDLTRREAEVLDCLAKGWVQKEIAARLAISI